MLPHESRSDVENRHASELSRLRAEIEMLTDERDDWKSHALRMQSENVDLEARALAAEAREAKAVEDMRERAAKVEEAIKEALHTLEKIQEATLDEDGDIDYYETAASGIQKIKAIRSAIRALPTEVQNG